MPIGSGVAWGPNVEEKAVLLDGAYTVPLHHDANSAGPTSSSSTAQSPSTRPTIYMSVVPLVHQAI